MIKFLNKLSTGRLSSRGLSSKDLSSRGSASRNLSIRNVARPFMTLLVLSVGASFINTAFANTGKPSEFEKTTAPEQSISHSGNEVASGVKNNLNKIKMKDNQDWQLVNLEGEKIRLSDYKGQPVLLIFWATWCPYCKKLLPGIQTLNDKYHSLGLKVIGVNIKEDWKPHVYWRNHEYTFDTVLEGDEIANHYGIKGTPGIVFIDPRGAVLAVKSFSDPNHPTLEAFAKKYTSDK